MAPGVPGRHADPPGGGLDLGVDDADADITAPALALQVAHHVAAEGLLVEVEAFQRAEVVAVGQADAAADIGVVRIVDRGRAHRGVDRLDLVLVGGQVRAEHAGPLMPSR
jgi:hypothetical protein